jgi:hypothetical protein
MEYLIIPILIAVVIAICGIMATIPAPHTYAKNVKVHEPMVHLPPYLDLRSEYDRLDIHQRYLNNEDVRKHYNLPSLSFFQYKGGKR